ncbi:MAG TPA: type VI secretion system accessory protein TagJ [Bryobacteraceae bacterium]|jgi:type VI secretion system protein ImpE
MKAKELYQAGKLSEAVQALSAEIRDNPTDAQRRIFLFELLCFAGDYDRADKHLNYLSGQSPQAQMGAVMYMACLHGERSRHQLFADKNYPSAPVDESKARGGMLDGAPFDSIEDSDPRIGPRLELFAAGAYLWIPFEHIEKIEFQPPKRVRELLWRPALVQTGPAFKDKELGEVLVPVLSPFSWKNPDDNVKLGRATVWEEPEPGHPVPYGQKTFLVDGEDIPILELTKIEFAPAEAAEPEASGAVN